MLSSNDTALKESGNSEHPAGDLKPTHWVHFGREFKPAEGGSMRETRGSLRRGMEEKQRNL